MIQINFYETSMSFQVRTVGKFRNPPVPVQQRLRPNHIGGLHVRLQRPPTQPTHCHVYILIRPSSGSSSL